MKYRLAISFWIYLVGVAACVRADETSVPATPDKLAAALTDCVHDTTTFRCVKYVRNYDADTVTFNIPNVHPLIGKNISVRVRHIDTPEIHGKQPCEKEAARNAKRLIENQLKNAKRIDLLDVAKDKYFRILADVIIDGRDLKEILVKNRLAYAYEGKAKQKLNWCNRTPAGYGNSVR